MAAENDLGRDNIKKLVIRIAVPSMLAQFVSVLYSIVDRMYIGNIPVSGDMALAGAGVCGPVVTMIGSVAFLVGIGGAPLMSMKMGQGDNKAAERILANCFLMLALCSVLMVACIYPIRIPMLRYFGASDTTLPYANAYFTIYLTGTVFALMSTGMNQFIICQGFAKTGMLSVLIGAVCNIVLDPVFIFGMHMGVRGAALATVISQACSTIWVLAFLAGKKTRLKIRLRNMGLTPSVILPCVALGAATFVMQSSESIISICFNSSLLKYGGDIAVGAMTILTSVMQFAMLPLQGIAQGAQPISSYNYGAKNADRVKKTFRLLLITCLSYSVLLWAAVQLVPRVFVSIFTADTSLIEFTAPMLKIYLGGLFLFGIQIACQMTFTSLGKAVNSIIVAVVRKFVLLIPLIYIMPHMISDSTTGVYMAEPIADITAVIFTSVLFTFQFKKALAEIQN